MTMAEKSFPSPSMWSLNICPFKNNTIHKNNGQESKYLLDWKVFALFLQMLIILTSKILLNIFFYFIFFSCPQPYISVQVLRIRQLGSGLHWYNIKSFSRQKEHQKTTYTNQARTVISTAFLTDLFPSLTQPICMNLLAANQSCVISICRERR